MLEPLDIPAHLPMLLDGMMVVAIAGLWIVWWRNAKRQRHIEFMLADSTRQLQEASHHLRQAMAYINNTSKKKAASNQRTTDYHNEEKTLATIPVRGDTRVTQMLRMQREGMQAEDIANKLGLPLSQVRLALKLHASGTH